MKSAMIPNEHPKTFTLLKLLKIILGRRGGGLLIFFSSTNEIYCLYKLFFFGFTPIALP